MRSRPTLWFLLSLLCLLGAAYLWYWSRELKSGTGPNFSAASQAQAPTANQTVPAANSRPQPLLTHVRAANPVIPAKPRNYHVSNTAKTPDQLLRNDHVILLENATVDTEQAGGLDIPGHLQVQGDGGSYIVQARRPLDDRFRAHLSAAGATIISYIPNNAYLVRASASGANQLAANPDTQTVMPFEPYFKVAAELLPFAVEQQPLPHNNGLVLTLFADAHAATLQALPGLGAFVIAEERSPFGPVLTVAVPDDALVALAQLPGVQRIENFHPLVSANDLSRVRLRAAANTLTASNYLGLTGKGVTVNVTDTGVNAAHPDLAPRVFGDRPASLDDTDGHGTHVAGIIASSGSSSLSPVNIGGVLQALNYGSISNASFRGKATNATLFSIKTGLAAGPGQSGQYFQETAARTNAYISNNSWNYDGAYAYTIGAASYDAAVRDALPSVSGEQPVVFVFPAGNNGGGNANNGIGGNPNTIPSPATAKNVITVGAVEQFRNITNGVLIPPSTNEVQFWLSGTDSSNQVAGFSGRGPVFPNRFKPDVVAPGTFVVSTRSTNWDQQAYYNPSNILVNSFFNQVVPTNVVLRYSALVPYNATVLRIIVTPNAASPTPFPDFPIFVSSTGPAGPANYSVLGTNQVTISPVNPIPSVWYYSVGNSTTQAVSFDVRSEIVVTNQLGNYYTVLSNLNETIGPYYRFESGSSMAAASVSGMLALMQEFYEQFLHVTNSPAMMKALLINGARNLNPSVYNFRAGNINYQGWGLPDLTHSIPPAVNAASNAPSRWPVILRDQSPTNALATGQSHTYEISITNTFVTNQPLRVTLVWTDPPANPAAAITLVNELDLVVTNLVTTNFYLGNDFPSGSSFSQPWDVEEPSNPDSTNNVENVYLEGPLNTRYTITVKAPRVYVNAIPTHTNNIVQDYALLISLGDGTLLDVFTSNLRTATTDTNFHYLKAFAVTNSATATNTASAVTLLHERVGANSPLIGTNIVTNILDSATMGVSPVNITTGQTNQWNFYVVTNGTSFTNAAFLTFDAINLSIPRMGVFANTLSNATRVEADIDLYVSTNFTLTNLDMVAVSNAYKSCERGGTETVTLSNAQPGQVFYVGIKAEDQMAAEYGFSVVFSASSFGQSCEDVVVEPLSPLLIIPDGSPQKPAFSDPYQSVGPSGKVRKVTVHLTGFHEHFGDLLGQLEHNGVTVVLNSHEPLGEDVFFDLYFDDSGEGTIPNSQPSDGPGSLRDFVGQDADGQWQFTMVDNALTHTGVVQVAVCVDIQDPSDKGVAVTIEPQAWFYDFVDIPIGATNFTVMLTNMDNPVQLYLRYGAFPETNIYDYFVPVNVPPGSNSISVSIFDTPPLRPGRWFIGIYNPGTVQANGTLITRIDFGPAETPSTIFNATNAVALPDNAVVYSFLTNLNVGTLSGVEVGLLIKHPRVSDLAVTLISPNGRRILLYEDRGAYTENIGIDPAASGLGTFGIGVTNLLPYYTNDFDSSPIGLYAPSAVFQGWNVLSNMVAVVDDLHCLCLSNHVLGLLGGAVSNSLPTTNSTSYELSFRVSHLPWLEGTISWWPFDGNGQDIFGGMDAFFCCNVISTNGEVNQAYYADGYETRGVVAGCPALDVGAHRRHSFTIEGWINPDDVTSAAPLVEWNDVTNTVNPLGVQFWISGLFTTNGSAAPGTLNAFIWDTNQVQAPIVYQGSPTNSIATAPFTLTNGGWQHVALTYDWSSGTARLYTNGWPAATNVLGQLFPRTTGDLYFGYHPAGPGATLGYAGGLDEFGLYDRALSDCEVQAIFTAGSRGKYGTNCLTCPVAMAVEFPGLFPDRYNFTNGVPPAWTNGPTWQTNVLQFTVATAPSPTNRTPIYLRPWDPNVVVDNLVLSALLTNYVDAMMHFTEDTNVAITAIKFAPTPYLTTNFPPILIFTNDFEYATQRVYGVGSILPGPTNGPAIGARDWTVIANPITVVSNAGFAVMDTNYVALARGAVQCTLPTTPGHRYELSYAVRGPCAVSWWNGDTEPLSQRAEDLLSGNHGAFLYDATNRANAAFVGNLGLHLPGMITNIPPGVNDIAGKIEIGDMANLWFTNAFTIEGWIQQTLPDLYPSNDVAPQEMIFFRGDLRNCADPYYLALIPNATRTRADIKFHIKSSDNDPSCGVDLITTNRPIAFDQWQHIAAVFEAAVPVTNALWFTNVMQIWVNSVRQTNILWVNAQSLTNGYTGLQPFRELDASFSPGITIGNRARADASEPFSGNIDELTAYARALTPPEIQAIVAAGQAGKADLAVPAQDSLAQLSVSLNGVERERVYAPNSEWTTHTLVFTARQSNSLLRLESLLPGTLVDRITLTEVPKELFYLPEEFLSALKGEDAFGIWQLEILDTRTGATNNNPELVQWQLNLQLEPEAPLPILYPQHGIPVTSALPARGIQYLVVNVPQWATMATNILQSATRFGTTNPLPVTVLFNQTNFPGLTDLTLIGPASTGTNTLTTNGTPPLAIGQTYYLAVTNPNPFGVNYALGVWFDIQTLPNCEVITNYVGPAGIPRYLQFDIGDVDTNHQSVTFWLYGANSNLTVVLSEHLPLPDLARYDYISQSPCTNHEIVMVLTNSTPFPIQTNRWYVGIYNTTETNVQFVARVCYTNYPQIIPLTNGVPFDAPIAPVASQFVAPPGPPQRFFFEFDITDPTDAVLFELYNLSGDADLVLQRYVPPGMAPYFERSYRLDTTPEQIVLRSSFELPDLRGKWFLGVYNNELTNVGYTIRAALPVNGQLVSGLPIVLTNTVIPPSGQLLSWNAVIGERYFVESTTDGTNWIVVGSVAASTPCATFVIPCIPLGPISWWPGNSNTTDIADGNNGTLGGNTTYGPGINGPAFEFDGTTSFVSVPASANLNVGIGSGFTVEGWINPSTLALERPIIEWNSGSGPNPYGAHFWISAVAGGGPGCLFANLVDTLGNPHFITSAGGLLVVDAFQHVALTYDRSSGVAKLYLNGNVVAQSNLGVFTPQTSYELSLGRRTVGFSQANHWAGKLDEIAIYNRALTDLEVQAIYSAGGISKCATPAPCIPLGPISWWPGNSNTTDLADGNNGTWTGTGNLNTYGTGIVSSAFVFDGIHRDRVDVGNPTNLQLEDFTIEAWVRRFDPSQVSFDDDNQDGAVAGEGGVIFGYGRGGYGFALYNDGRMVLTRMDLDGITSSPLVTDTNWHHLAVTKVGLNVVFYKDGVPEIAPGYIHPNPYTFDDGTCTCTASASIGSRGDARGGTLFGAIDELAIYGRALTATEIQSIYSAGAAGKCTSPTSFRVVQTPQNPSLPLPPYQPMGNTVAAGEMIVYAVNVPSWASYATNLLISASGPVNLIFNQFIRPTGTNANDVTLLANSTAGTVALVTNGVPQLQPGQRYYLGVQNTGATPVTFSVEVDFNFTPLTNGVPVNSLADTPTLPRYFYYDVSSNATSVAFQLYNLSGNANLVVRRGLPWPTLGSADYAGLNAGTLSEDINLFTNSTPVPLAPGRWYLGVFDAVPGPVSYTIRATESTNLIITLTNAIPYFNTNTASVGTNDFYRFVVSTNAARAQFEINNPSADMTLVVRKGLPLPDLFSFDYLSGNATTNDEVIIVFTNSTPVPLSPGEWYLTAVNVSGGPVSYSIKATEWPVTGRPIVITNTFVASNSFCITWTSLPGVRYHVDGKPLITTPNWTTVSPVITATGYSTTWCLPLPSPFHYFRVVEGATLSAFVPPPVITSITRINNVVTLQWLGPATARYQVQWSPTLAPPAWNSFTNVVTSPNGLFSFTDNGTQTGGVGGTRFYRLRLYP